MANIILWGIGSNLLLLIIYYFFNKQIEKLGTVREKVIIEVRRARLSYLYLYIIIIAVIAFTYKAFQFSPTGQIIFFAGIAAIIILDIHHDRQRLVLTKNEVVFIKGFLSTKAVTIEYREVVLIEVDDLLIGRILGYGNIKIMLTGKKEFTFPKIPKYLQIKNMMEKRKLEQEA